MRAVVQRVREAAVAVDGEVVGRCGPGLLVLACAMAGDGAEDADFLAGKIVKLRVFADDAGKMNRSLLDTGGGILAVSQFTLAADWRKGNRPSFSSAAPPAEGEALFDRFCNALRAGGAPVETGRFGADMKVSLVNDGPVTIIMDTAES